MKYFLMNFNRLSLKELIATGYKTSPIGGSEVGSPKSPYALRVKETKKYLIGDQTDLDVRGAKWLLDAEGPNIMTPLIGNLAKDKDGNQIMEEISETYVDDKTGKKKKRKIKQPLYYEAGDFRSDISIELLKESDIVVTNPPFSLFREYVSQLMEYGKKFLIIGNKNAITYKEFFPLLKNNQVWLGYCSPVNFISNDGTLTKQVSGLCRWFTNLDHAKRHQMLPLDLGFTYYGHEDMYPKYDNYDAINVDKVSQIPCDYEPCWYKCPKAGECEYAKTEGKEDKALCENSCNGEIGVPITYMDKHCPEQFEIIKFRHGDDGKDLVYSAPICSQFVNAERERERERDAAYNHTSESLSARKKCNGIIGVPITFLDKYCPEQFRIIGHEHDIDGVGKCGVDVGQFEVSGNGKYKRILIQKMQRSDGNSDNFSG